MNRVFNICLENSKCITVLYLNRLDHFVFHHNVAYVAFTPTFKYFVRKLSGKQETEHSVDEPQKKLHILLEYGWNA